MFHTIYIYQFGWLSERGGNFFNLLQKEGSTQKGGRGGGGVPSEKGWFQSWRKLRPSGTQSQKCLKLNDAFFTVYTLNVCILIFLIRPGHFPVFLFEDVNKGRFPKCVVN